MQSTSSLLLLLLLGIFLSVSEAGLLQKRRDRLERNQKEADAYVELRSQGVDEVGHTTEAAALRSYQLRKKKRTGILRKREASLTDVLFPGVTPELYKPGEEVFIITELVQSKKTHVPFEFYDLPGCPKPVLSNFKRIRKRHARKNLGARLQGIELKPAPYKLEVMTDVSCTVLCGAKLAAHEIRWLRKLVERQYRVHLTFDQLPVLMRSQELNYAVRGFPIGFKAPPSYTGLDHDEYYLYNHLKFSITVNMDKETGGYHITGFDVFPVSIEHSDDGSTCGGGDDDEEVPEVTNDPNTYLTLRGGQAGMALPVTFSYEVEWVESDLPWADRWDVYLIGSPDDDIHFFAIVNSLMIVLFLTGAIATILIRTLRKDISAYNEMSLLDDAAEETGWKLVHGDVFRPPQSSPMMLAVVVGTGTQIGSAFFITLLAAMFKLVNPIRKGQTLTAVLVLYVLSGCVSGYVSARVSKFCECKSWKTATFLTATLLPGFLVGVFTILNVYRFGC
jgi:transmembrane 9 superfamily member 2/4